MAAANPDQDPALPNFEVPINDKGGATSKYWYFFFQGLLNRLFSLTLTDGATTVNNVDEITVVGGTVTGTSPNATITVTGGSGSGTVTSVELTSTDSSIFVTGTNPITTAGTIDISLPFGIAGLRFTTNPPGLFSALNCGLPTFVRNSVGDYTVSWTLAFFPRAITMSLEDASAAPGIVFIGPLDYDQTFININTMDLTGTLADILVVINIIAIG